MIFIVFFIILPTFGHLITEMKTLITTAFCFIFILFLAPAASAQQDDVELWQAIQKLPQNPKQGYKLALALAPIAPAEAISYAQDALSMAYNDYTAQAQCYLALGIANYYGETFGKATQYLQKISKLKDVLPATQIQAWQYLAMCMVREDDKSGAEKYFDRAGKEAEKIGDKNLQAQTALFRAESNNTAQALTYYQTALALFEATRNEIGYAKTAQAMGDFYTEQLNVPLTAIFYYQKVLAISDRLQEKRLLADALNGMGYLYAQKQKDAKSALRYYYQAFVIAQEYDFFQNGSKLAQSLKGISNCYQALAKDRRNAGEAEKAHEYDKLADRYQALMQGLARADYDVQLFSIASPEPRTYTSPAPERPKRNLPAQTLRKTLKTENKSVLSDSQRKADSLLLAEKNTQIDHWQNQHAKNEDEKQQQELEIRKYRNFGFWGLLGLIGVLGTILGYAIYYMRLQKKLIAHQKEKVQEAQDKAKRIVIAARDHETAITQTRVILDDKQFENASFRKILQEDVLRNLNAPSVAKQERARYALASLLHESTPIQAHLALQPIAPIWHEAVGKVAPILHEQQIKLEQQIAENMQFMCDATLLEGVFVHLLHNSCKYVAQGGLIKIDANSTEKHMILTYQDNGQGIPASLHTQSFRKFPVQDARPLAHSLHQAKQLMEAQKGTMALLPNAMGITVSLQFPRDRQS